jgi:hypothetical protein
MIGLVTAAVLAVLFAVLLAGLVVAIVDRWRGQPWIMRPYFAREWSQRHMDDESPVGAFERWLTEWHATRIQAGRWIDREYPAYDHRHPVDDTARRHNDATHEQRRREHWRLAPTMGR